MRISEMDWRMVEDWLRHDDRCALPLGSTEQHAGLSLATDAILAERVAAEAAEPLGVPVFPALGFALAFSQGDSPPGPTSWLCTLLPPPTDLVIALQHFLI